MLGLATTLANRPGARLGMQWRDDLPLKHQRPFADFAFWRAVPITDPSESNPTAVFASTVTELMGIPIDLCRERSWNSMGHENERSALVQRLQNKDAGFGPTSPSFLLMMNPDAGFVSRA